MPTATSATESVASSSRAKDERKAIRSVRSVARRYSAVIGADRLGLRLGPAEDLEGRQAGDHVEEVAGQPGQQPPLAVHPGLGGPADEHHEQRDQRQGHAR